MIKKRVLFPLLGLVAIVFLIASLVLTCLPDSSRKAQLTPDERQWLESHPVIRLAPDPNFPPIEWFDEHGNYKGLVADLFARIQPRLGVRFEFVHEANWSQVLASARDHSVDGITAAQETPDRQQYLQFTDPILNIPNVIIVNRQREGSYSFDKMSGMRVAITRGNALDEYIRTHFPEIQLDPVDNDLEALYVVSFNRADATVVNVAIASYLIQQNGIANLRVAGDSGRDNSLHIAARIDQPILKDILQKGLDTLSQQERSDIFTKWVKLENDQAIYLQRVFWQMIALASGIAVLALIAMVGWNYALRRQVELRTAELKNELSERRKVEARNERQMERMWAAQAVDVAISAHLDSKVVLELLLDELNQQLQTDAADVLLLAGASGELEYAAGRGFSTHAIERTRLSLGTGAAGQAALERRTVHVADFSRNGNHARAEALREENFIAYCSTPVITRDQVIGVLEVFQRSPNQLDEEGISFLELMARQAAIAVDNAEMTESLRRSNEELVAAWDATLEGWVKALDLRDKDTERHSQDVVHGTLGLARLAGIQGPALADIRRGALLHDIGKMAVPDHVLHKDGPLSEEEWVIMRDHPLYAFNWLSPITYLRGALDIPYCHHERWDGTGYPRGLKAEEIPLAARLFAVIDVYHALIEDRVYRKGWPQEKVVEYIRSEAGKQFDPWVVDLFMKYLQDTAGETRPAAVPERSA